MWALNLSFSTIHPKIVISLKENSMGICVYLNGFFRPNKQQWAWTKIWMNQNQIYENKKNPFHFNYVRQILVGYYLKILKQFAELWLFPKYLCLYVICESPLIEIEWFFFQLRIRSKIPSSQVDVPYGSHEWKFSVRRFGKENGPRLKDLACGRHHLLRTPLWADFTYSPFRN